MSDRKYRQRGYQDSDNRGETRSRGPQGPPPPKKEGPLVRVLGPRIAQVFADPDSVIPMVGASGAIGGVMGGIARRFGWNSTLLRVLFVIAIVTVTYVLPMKAQQKDGADGPR